MNRVIHFEIGVDRPERAIKFYSEVFGWEIKKWEGPVEYWMVMTGPADKPGIDGGLMKNTKKVSGVVNSVGVDSVDGFIRKIRENGGEVVTPKTTIPGVGYMAYCKDTEGNVFGIYEEDRSAR